MRPDGTEEILTAAAAPRGTSSRTRRALALGLTAALIATLALTAAACGGGKTKASDGTTPTVEAPTVPAETPTPGANAGLKTPIAISPGNILTREDLANRGTGVPGRGDFTGERLLIPSIGVDAPFSYKVVGLDGQMPNPDSWDDVSYYDFSQWPNMGGLPGKGGNVVLAGHVDYIRHGPAVFWRLHELAIGDTVTVRQSDGTEVSYQIEFNKVLELDDADWSAIVSATADESITLITCGGEFEAGHYNNRQIVWGRRV
ncbi:MAG: class F sortase [Chloroflexi bacterium]|nr:class F sortase [Chloroflexota bacterium]